MNIVELDQGTADWHAWRVKHIGGSDASIIAAYWLDDVCSWPYGQWAALDLWKLWRLKTGQSQPKQASPNSAMAHGNRTEQAAREWYMLETGNPCAPVCVEHPKAKFVAASLDGTADGKLHIAEIKCPREPDTWELANAGKVPAYYVAQIQHNLYAAQAEVCDFIVYYRKQGKIVQVKRNERLISRLLDAEQEFWSWVEARKFPLPEGESERDDADWKVAVEGVLAAQAQVRFGEDNLKRARSRLFRMMNAARVRGAGYVATIGIKNGYVERKPREVEDSLSLKVEIE